MSKHYTRKLLESFRNEVCMGCGEKSGSLHVHHVNHDNQDDRTRNIILYCRKCHRRHHIKNGRSKTIQKALVRIKGPGLSIRNFDLKYTNRGGISGLADMAINQKMTLAAMGKHFGLTREYIRQILFVSGIRKGKYIKQPYEIGTRSSTVERKLKNLYKWIIDHDMMIGEFARTSGIPASRLSCLLTGRINPNYEDMSKIKSVTGMAFEDILEIKPADGSIQPRSAVND